MAHNLNNAERQARYRQRLKVGARVVLVEVWPDFITALVSNGWLSAAEAQDAQKLADAVADFLDCWARGTLGPVTRNADFSRHTDAM